MKATTLKFGLVFSILGVLALAGVRSAHAQQIVTNIAAPSGLDLCAVNPALNKLYFASGNPAAEQIVVVDGVSFSQTGVGNGDDVDVDVTNNNYWSAGVYSDSVTAWNSSNVALASPATGSGCAVGVSVDAPHRRVWVGAQCSDSIWVFNADTYALVAGPISPGGVMGFPLVNPATDRAYFNASGSSKRVNPSTFAVTANTFGTVIGVNASANLLYAAGSGTTFQIVNGAPDPEVVLTNITLPYTFGSRIGVNPALNRIYIGYNSTNIVAILNATTGQSIGNISLGAGITSVGSIVVDASRNRVYALASGRLFVIQDNAAPTFQSATYLGTTGADVVGTGVKFYGGSLYVSGNSAVSSGILAGYATPLVPAAVPLWRTNWPDSNPSDQFNAVTASSTGIYADGSDYTRTTDTQGGKEGKGLVAKFPLAGPTGSGFGGDIWDQQTPAAPGAFGYGGGEGLNGLTLANEAGVNFVYATGAAQHDGANGGRLFISKLAENSTVLWTQNDGAEMVGEAYSVGYALAALNTNVYAAGINTDVNTLGQPYLRKYSAAGSLAWVRRDSFVGAYLGITGVTGVTNYIYAVGYSGTNTGPTANLNFLIEKWDENGNQIWSHTYDRSSAQDSLNGVVSVSGRLFAVGSTRGQTAGGADAVLAEFDPANGNLLSTTLYGGSLDDIANAVDSDGSSLYVVGGTRSYGNGSNQIMVLQYALGPVLTNIVVTPVNTVIGGGTNEAFVATGYFSDGSSSSLAPTNGVVWNSSNPSVATITTNGLATGLSVGTTTIKATVGSINGSTALSVVVIPSISTNPVSATASSGGTVTLSVSANGGGLSYQWQLNGTNISGATGASLTITNLSATNFGVYRVIVNNAAGSVASVSVTLASVDIHLLAAVYVNGPIGSNYLIQATSNLLSSWTTLTNVALPTQPYIYIDYSSVTNKQQFYRALPQ